jgi:hypothetical protein
MDGVGKIAGAVRRRSVDKAGEVRVTGAAVRRYPGELRLGSADCCTVNEPIDRHSSPSLRPFGPA